ncbi:hypothetical protein WR25_05483 isoform A [Diploscapter pachys]|uniref:Uncharacterized protein n=1 Tax=Diploscapter pachys TaxID=2018661 RepID=A0A2A2LXG5_9BILA|nr:hypothetical protein WR25_05483 isoform A [Diploscapter pachys]
MQELTETFDFQPISVEDIVFNYLPKKLDNSIESTPEVIDHLKRDGGILTIDWILAVISSKISASMHQRFVIDIVPSVTAIMRSDNYKQRDHDRTLESFEHRHPIAFALELRVLNEEELLRETTERKEQEKTGVTDSGNLLKGMDEADKGRLERRMDQSHRCQETFLRYFQRTKRVITLTLPGPVTNAISTVSEMLTDFGFSSKGRQQRVIAFAQSDNEFVNMDLEFYKMKKIYLKDIVKSRSEGLVTKLETVYRVIEQTGNAGDNFAVILDVDADHSKPMVKRINFIEQHYEAYLDEFITDKNYDKKPKTRTRISVNIISSPNQHLLLFVQPFPQQLAQEIGVIFHAIPYSRASSVISRES